MNYEKKVKNYSKLLKKDLVEKVIESKLQIENYKKTISTLEASYQDQKRIRSLVITKLVPNWELIITAVAKGVVYIILNWKKFKDDIMAFYSDLKKLFSNHTVYEESNKFYKK